MKFKDMDRHEKTKYAYRRLTESNRGDKRIDLVDNGDFYIVAIYDPSIRIEVSYFDDGFTVVGVDSYGVFNSVKTHLTLTEVENIFTCA